MLGNCLLFLRPALQPLHIIPFFNFAHLFHNLSLDMKGSRRFIINILLSYACSAHAALQWDGPEPTQAPDLANHGADIVGWSQAPMSEPSNPVGFWRRQSLNVPSNVSHATCGYISGSSS